MTWILYVTVLKVEVVPTYYITLVVTVKRTIQKTTYDSNAARRLDLIVNTRHDLYRRRIINTSETLKYFTIRSDNRMR